jgi:uroporphyrin-III C-methyltransferase
MTAISHNPNQRGSCTLVGAGPGDPELLTIKAAKAIAAASVLFVDDLVSDGVMSHASPSARVVYVGKRGGCKSTPQAFIEKLMIAAVQDGERVVRLKGGDPFIFGRGGEEVEHLREAGIEVDVINGITSGLAGLTSLGAPLTHRDRAHGVLFMTGHAKPGDRPRLAPDRRHGPCRQADAGDLYGSEQRRAHQRRAAQRPARQHARGVIQHASLPQQRHALTF